MYVTKKIGVYNRGRRRGKIRLVVYSNYNPFIGAVTEEDTLTFKYIIESKKKSGAVRSNLILL